MIVNGKNTGSLPLSDRGLQYGDGSFTTMAVSESKIEWFDSHIKRLKSANLQLNICFEQFALLEETLLSEATRLQNGIIKVIITRGSGGRGYGTKDTGPATSIVTTHPSPQHYRSWRDQGIDLGESPILLAKQPLLAGIKHLNRLEQVLIKRHLETSEFSDALVCDTDGVIVESSVANVFWRRGNHWFTPDLTSSGIDGVMRNQVLSYFSRDKIKVNIVRERPEQLADVDELFICNSIMGLVSVNRIVLTTQRKSFEYNNVEKSKIDSGLSLIKYAV